MVWSKSNARDLLPTGFNIKGDLAGGFEVLLTVPLQVAQGGFDVDSPLGAPQLWEGGFVAGLLEV